MKKYILWITETAVMLALLVTLQLLTKGFGQLVTGSFVNGVLAVTVLVVGFSGGITVALISPVLAIGFFMRETDDELIDFHAALINETPTRTLVGFFDDLRVHQELAAAPRLRPLPGFVLVGQKDLVTPIAQSERIWQEWPKAWLQVAHGAGHMLPLEAPGSVNAAVDRLLRHLVGVPGN